ncbi:hypothetical protein [Candidatus Palauibacter sp.]|uniref:hypothetical protein n=1 Tax=Candidatus Palauibacter sp. TaxID=3101350 RepID=UPI003AF26C89
MDILNLTRLISERAAPPLSPLPLAHLGYYDQLRHHRCFITHGMLTIASRNMAHLQRTRRQLGHDDLSNPAVQAAVQDAMLRNQASKPSAGRRWLLEVTTWAPWSVYLCLLLAELEHYRRQQTPDVSYAPVNAYLHEALPFTDPLEVFRDKFLHPKKPVRLFEILQEFMAATSGEGIDYSTVASIGQGVVDDYLGWLHARLYLSLVDQKSRLSKSRTEQIERVLALPLPQPPGQPAHDVVQMRIQPQTAAFLNEMQSVGLELSASTEAEFVHLLLPSIAIRNERLARSNAKMGHDGAAWASGGDPRASSARRRGAAKRAEESEFEASCDAVAWALLHDPVRIYRKTSRQWDFKVEAIEDLATDEAFRKYSGLRNMVFHVGPGHGGSRGAVPAVDWAEAFRKSDYTQVVAGLLRLCGSGRLRQKRLQDRRGV